MPLFIDVHQGLGGATPEDVQAAHERDLSVQTKHGVRYLTYWFNDPAGRVFCLVDAATKAAAVACHKEAHGLLPHDIIEVAPPSVEQFLGDWRRYVSARALIDGAGSPGDTAMRAIMFTDIEGSASMNERLGDAATVGILRLHNSIIRERLAATGGIEVKHTGDGIMASFASIARAVECTITIQRAFDDHARSDPATAVRLRIGLSAGEPVEDSRDLFGAAVNLAARACARAEAGQILATSVVKELCIGKQFDFRDRGVIALKGFSEPVQMYEVAWRK